VTKREDGKETRWKLLNAACEIFAQKGYRDAKVAEICRRAGANVASVNYHFGDKASLYKEAWQHALQNIEDPAASEPTADSPQDLLRAYIQTLILHFSANSELGRFSRLYLRELVNPTGLIQDAWHELMEPRRRRLHGILRDIAGPEVEDLSILFCELSIVNQCRALVTIKSSDLNYMLGQPLSPALVQRLARHIADFSLAGIKAVGKAEPMPTNDPKRSHP
jgi:AcrR family transcriptional regulator